MSKCEVDSDCDPDSFCDASLRVCNEKPTQAFPWSIVVLVVVAGLFLVILYYNILKRLRAGQLNVKPFIIAAVVIVVLAIIIAFLLKPKQPKCGNQTIQCGAGTVPLCNVSTGYEWQCAASACKDPDILDKKCGGICRAPCPPEKPYYDCTSKQCLCDPSTPACGDSSICCPPEDCQRDDQGKAFCCSSYQRCKDPKTGAAKCCSGGDVCVNGNSCVPACGFTDPSDPDKSVRTCKEGETCTRIKGLSEANAQSLKEVLTQKDSGAIMVKEANGTYTLLLCMGNTGCQFETTRGYAPFSVGKGFYPCFQTDKYDLGVGLNVCLSDNPSSDEPAQTTCYAHKSQGDCQADTANKCRWMDAMDEVATAGSDFSLKFGIGSGQPYGWWCSGASPQSSFSRLVVAPVSQGTCTALDCWNQMAQESVTDLSWDGTSCVALQGCDPSFSGGYSNTISVPDQQGGPSTEQKNPKVANLKPSPSSSEPVVQTFEDYMSCGTKPSDVTDPYYCDTDGRVEKQLKYSCVYDATSQTQNCQPDPNGLYTDPQCGGMCYRKAISLLEPGGVGRCNDGGDCDCGHFPGGSCGSGPNPECPADAIKLDSGSCNCSNPLCCSNWNTLCAKCAWVREKDYKTWDQMKNTGGGDGCGIVNNTDGRWYGWCNSAHNLDDYLPQCPPMSPPPSS